MPVETGVKEPASLPADAEVEKKVRENLRAEYERKNKEELGELKTQVAELKELLTDRLENLADKDNKTPEDKREIATLKEKLDAIKRNPESDPWRAFTEEVAGQTTSKAVEDALYAYDYRNAMKLVAKTAKELKVEGKEFEEALFDILKGGRWDRDAKGNRVMPTERVENAIEEWQRINSMKSEIDKAKEKEKLFAEAGGRVPRSESKKEELEAAKKSGKFSGVLADLAAKQAARQ